tara:strand:- start:154 stop:516 length:363 start_codon:yes stop_codon:yes gene_type:complete
MRFFKKIIILKKNKNYIYFLMFFYLFNSVIVLGSGNKSELLKNSHKGNTFEKIYFKHSVPFEGYDNLTNQLKTFFGLNDIQTFESNYPDLAIINSSKAIREIYRSGLNEMTLNKFIYKID